MINPQMPRCPIAQLFSYEIPIYFSNANMTNTRFLNIPRDVVKGFGTSTRSMAVRCDSSFTIWLWLTHIAMERFTMLLIGKPSIFMGHLYHGYVSHNQRVPILFTHTWSSFTISLPFNWWICWNIFHTHSPEKFEKKLQSADTSCLR